MYVKLRFLFFLGLVLLLACERELEVLPIPIEMEYQPLQLGTFWIYAVDETVYYGENDAEQEFYYYRDWIRTFYTNGGGEQVFVIQRSRSEDNEVWENLLEYTVLLRGNQLVKTLANQPLVSLVFPPVQGKTWDANVYRNAGEDRFEIDYMGSYTVLQVDYPNSLRILQEENDDKITFRNNRYEVYAAQVGMIEKYEEVLTYCSRNDCLGEQLIDSGVKTDMKLIGYGVR